MAAHPLRRLGAAVALVVGAVSFLSPLDALAGNRPSTARQSTVTSSADARVALDTRAVSRFDFDLVTTRTARLSASNSATATAAGCDGCRAVALSFQIVLVSGSPLDLTANNAASAINTGCSRCQTLAIAHQFIVVTDRPVALTAEAARALATIERALNRLSRSVDPPAQIEPQVSAYADEIGTLVLELVETPTSTTGGNASPRPTVHHRERVSSSGR